MGFEAVPNEIACMILQHLPSQDLSAISSTCRSLHIMVEPILFSTLGTQETTRKVVPLLIRTILERPQLGLWLKDIKLSHPSFRKLQYYNKRGAVFKSEFDANCFSTFQPEIMILLKQYMGDGEGRNAFEIRPTRSTCDIVRCWFTSIFRLSNFDSLVALLLLLVPNLKRLVFDGYPRCDSRGLSYTHRVLYTASSLQRDRATTNVPFSLPKLEDLSMAYEKDAKLYMDYLVPLFRMPSLRTLSCNGCDLNYACLLTFSSSIQNLALLNFIYDRSPQLRSILALFNRLETMTIEISYGYDNTHYPTIIDSIAHSQSTLQELKVTKSKIRYWHESINSVPSFAPFQNLKSLDFEWYFLNGHVLGTGRQFCLVDLPSSLENLVLQNTPREWMLGFLVNNMQQLGAIPRLAKMEICPVDSVMIWGKWDLPLSENVVSEWGKTIVVYKKHGCILSLPEKFSSVMGQMVTVAESVFDSSDGEMLGFISRGN